MSELERWEEARIPAEIRRLLVTARGEQPSAVAVERALAGAALGALALTGETAAAAAPAGPVPVTGAAPALAAVGGAGHTAMGTAPAALTLPALVKPLIGGFVVGAAVCAGATLVVAPRATRTAPAVAVVVSAAVPAPPPRPVPSGRADPTPAPSRGVSATPGSTPSGARWVSPDAALLAEIALVDAARAALDAGDADAALTLLARHAREHGPRSRLAPEVRALRLEALSRLGRRQEARDAARDILAHDRGTPHQAKAEALLAQPSAGGSAIDVDPGNDPPLPSPPEDP